MLLLKIPISRILPGHAWAHMGNFCTPWPDHQCLVGAAMRYKRGDDGGWSRYLDAVNLLKHFHDCYEVAKILRPGMTRQNIFTFYAHLSDPEFYKE